MNEELDSQLSAMFDNELPAAECELLARRLSRDEDLKARWGRYAAIGATIRAEGGLRLNSGLALRVSTAISSDPEILAAEPAVVAEPVQATPNKVASRWWMPIAGLSVAASVAAAAILFLRFETPSQSGQLAVRMAPATTGRTLVGQNSDGSQLAATSTPDSYVVPKTLPRRSIVPATQLANYVVAHSEFSSPVNRRNLLSAFMASESGTAGVPSGSDVPTEEVNDDAKSPH